MSVELTLLSGVRCRGRDVTSPRLRGLLALLAAEPRTGVSVLRLVDGLWPDERPGNPAKALQVVVSRARSQLGADVIASTPAGYRLGLDESEVDASAVLLAASASARCARDGDPSGALAHAEEGLALWAAPPEAGEGTDPLSLLRAERAVTYRTLARTRALALARLARHAEAYDALTAEARAHPRDEEVTAWLLRCEAATAGPSAALARYETYRRTLRADLGTDPGAALQAVQQELLRDEAPAVRRGVAHDPNPLLGRDGDIAAVLELLRTSRVTSIVGTGGLGKTRLANAVAREAPQRSVHFVALAGVARNEDVAAEVASVLGVGDPRRPAAGRLGGTADRLGGIVETLGPGPVLLVLDNCEHVVDGAAALAGGLVSMTRDLRVLTTSRAPLAVSSESVYPLPALDLPTAVELFRQRAHAARPNAALPAGAVEELCRHLDGLPLAVELAAARARVMSLHEIGRGLDDRFALLRGNARDAPSRHRTMHAVVEWSWNLLGPSGRAAMRSLSIFSAGFTMDAARHFLDGDVLETLEDLVGQSLLEMTESGNDSAGGPEGGGGGSGSAGESGSGTRFRMLESVREFSAARREAAGETGAAIGGLLAWAREFGAGHQEALFGAGGLTRVRAEQDNLLQALRHGLARGDRPAVAAVTAVLGGMWMLDSTYDRMIVLAEETAGPLSRFRPGPEDVETARAALTINSLTSLLMKGPRPTRALVALRRLPPAPPNSLIAAMATLMAAGPELLEPDGGASLLDQMCASGEPLLAALANCVAGYIRERDGDLAGALTATEAMLATVPAPMPTTSGTTSGTASAAGAVASGGAHSPWLGLLAHSRLSELLMQLDQGERAAHHLRVSLDLLKDNGWSDMFGLLWALAAADLGLGDADRAERWLDQSLVSGPDEGFGTATFNLGARAEIAFSRGDAGNGLRLWRQAVERLADEGPLMSAPTLDSWTLEAHCVAVVAHARHGRLDLVEDLAAGLPGRLSALLAQTPATMPAFFMDLPLCGGILLALALTDLARAGGPAEAPPAVRARAARTIALAERLHFVRNFQPTMSSSAARRDAEEADAAAYSGAEPEYAAMNGRELRAAARELAHHFNSDL